MRTITILLLLSFAFAKAQTLDLPIERKRELVTIIKDYPLLSERVKIQDSIIGLQVAQIATLREVNASREHTIDLLRLETQQLQDRVSIQQERVKAAGRGKVPLWVVMGALVGGVVIGVYVSK